jgi:hypothetical protein
MPLVFAAEEVISLLAIESLELRLTNPQIPHQLLIVVAFGFPLSRRYDLHSFPLTLTIPKSFLYCFSTFSTNCLKFLNYL